MTISFPVKQPEDCAGCGTVHYRTGQKYCAACHAAYMRQWRKTHRLSGEARRKDNVRSTASMAKRSGRLIPQPCQQCGAVNNVHMHHEDYDKPLEVNWLCRPCHLAHHGKRVRVDVPAR